MTGPPRLHFLTPSRAERDEAGCRICYMRGVGLGRELGGYAPKICHLSRASSRMMGGQLQRTTLGAGDGPSWRRGLRKKIRLGLAESRNRRPPPRG